MLFLLSGIHYAYSLRTFLKKAASLDTTSLIQTCIAFYP